MDIVEQKHEVKSSSDNKLPIFLPFSDWVKVQVLIMNYEILQDLIY
jgi:hypothetical protein